MPLNIRRVVSMNPLFAALPASRLGKIVFAARLRRFKAGEYAWRLGDSIGCYCVVAEGLLETSIPLRSGKVSLVELFKPTDVCGCLTDLRRAGALCNLRALTDAVLVCVPTSVVHVTGKERSFWFEAVARNLALRFERQIRLRTICSDVSRQSIPSLLLWLHDSTGDSIPLTQGVLAMIAGVTEETVCRALARLKKEGLILVARGSIHIRCAKTLQRYIESL